MLLIANLHIRMVILQENAMKVTGKYQILFIKNIKKLIIKASLKILFVLINEFKIILFKEIVKILIFLKLLSKLIL
jgi:hypothetical protein